MHYFSLRALPSRQPALYLALRLASLGWLSMLWACGGGDAATPPATVSAAPATAATLSCNLPHFSQDLLDRVNALRASGASCGGVAQPSAPLLSWNDPLGAAAAAHSQDMVARNFFSHQNPDGLSVGDRVSAQGYRYRIVGENIAAGQRSVQTVMDSWTSSPGHCVNLLRSQFSHLGVACVLHPADPNGYTYYWTMVLASPL